MYIHVGVCLAGCSRELSHHLPPSHSPPLTPSHPPPLTHAQPVRVTRCPVASNQSDCGEGHSTFPRSLLARLPHGCKTTIATANNQPRPLDYGEVKGQSSPLIINNKYCLNVTLSFTFTFRCPRVRPMWWTLMTRSPGLVWSPCATSSSEKALCSKMEVGDTHRDFDQSKPGQFLG